MVMPVPSPVLDNATATEVGTPVLSLEHPPATVTPSSLLEATATDDLEQTPTPQASANLPSSILCSATTEDTDGLGGMNPPVHLSSIQSSLAQNQDSPGTLLTKQSQEPRSPTVFTLC